jgi:tRNA/tmRNA/rRNA uracil-C5-methylase (TrmA/RlmC/RlmD family)
MSQTNAKNELTLDIDTLSYGPYGIGRHQGKAVMIPKTAPGDTVAARIVEAKERYSVGEIVRILKPSGTALSVCRSVRRLSLAACALRGPAAGQAKKP